MSALSEIHLEVGDILYREGDANNCAYVIGSGEVLLFYDADGSEIPCERRCAGHIVGEYSILTGRPRTVTVKALTPCVVFRISADRILEKFSRLDPVLRACVETSIDFVARFNVQEEHDLAEVPMAPLTLRNADKLIVDYRFELDLEKGLGRDEFFMVYQPILSLRDRAIAGVEALMRWHQPERGPVPPDEFIAVAESMESIGRITAFAIAECCATHKRLQAVAGPAFFASVNISGKDLGRAGFVDLLAHALDRHDLNPATLKLEVTETAFVPNSAVAEANLARIRSLGCGIAIDDFGTGYSNLAYLKSLPLSAIKIDRTFAGDVDTNPVSRGIVRMLVGLGQDLEVDVVAEGVENCSTAERLVEIGCGFAQGYHFHRPMHEAELTELLATSKPDRSVVG